MAFDNFLILVALYGSPLDWNYNDYGKLNTPLTWFSNLWELVHYFKSVITFRDDEILLGARENDRALMSEFYRLGYRNKELVSLNIVRHFCNLFHLSDISKCDGVTLDEYVLTNQSELSTRHVFLWEEPTSDDQRLWKEAILRLCSGTSILPI
jgi:hypothetical protein